MGGRGAVSGSTATSATDGSRPRSVQAVLPGSILADLPYNVTSFDDDRGGATFPFLEQTQRAWRILTRPEIGRAHV